MPLLWKAITIYNYVLAATGHSNTLWLGINVTGTKHDVSTEISNEYIHADQGESPSMSCHLYFFGTQPKRFSR